MLFRSLNNRREDWQNYHDDHYGHYGDWHHGNWNGNFGGWWDHMWDDHTAAMVLGVTSWGVNRIAGWYGYSSYENPYYDSGSGGGVITVTLGWSDRGVIIDNMSAATVSFGCKATTFFNSLMAGVVSQIVM